MQDYPASVPILLEFASFLIRSENFKDLSDVLTRVKKLRSERSPTYYAKYLEYSGVLAAYTEQYEAAIVLFKEALAIKESDELRSKLSGLEVSGKDYIKKIIKESKIIRLMDLAKIEVASKNWQRGLDYALKASDIDLNYRPSQLLLAEIQSKRGYFSPAIKTLEELKEQTPLDPFVNYLLITTYLKGYRIFDAKKILSDLAKTKLAKSAVFAESWGRYYYKIGEKIRAIKWLEEATLRNPLNDENYYLIAKILLKERKYKAGKQMLRKAVYLDPTNMEYRTMIANTLYELESAEVAIGYLRDILKDHVDHPMILGEIAKYYYKSGQNKFFEQYKKQVEALPKKDENFYEFMIEASQLEEKVDQVITYASELIKIKPGDIDTRMTLGEFLFRQRHFKDSLVLFDSITDRLDSYPRANYYKAKIKIVQGDLDEALKFAQLEIDKNPKLEFGHFILGEVYRKKQDYNRAKKNLEKSISINGRYVEALVALAWIKSRQNFLEPARELYLRALKEDKNNPIIRKELGHIYRGIGQRTLAIESYEIYLKLEPGAKDRSKIEAYIRKLQ